mgnify:CR=1 FL=1
MSVNQGSFHFSITDLIFLRHPVDRDTRPLPDILLHTFDGPAISVQGLRVLRSQHDKNRRFAVDAVGTRLRNRSSYGG